MVILAFSFPSRLVLICQEVNSLIASFITKWHPYPSRFQEPRLDLTFATSLFRSQRIVRRGFMEDFNMAGRIMLQYRRRGKLLIILRISPQIGWGKVGNTSILTFRVDGPREVSYSESLMTQIPKYISSRSPPEFPSRSSSVGST
jgi:hypothetical protein